MNYNDVKELIQIFNDSPMTEFELNIDNVSIRMGKNDSRMGKIQTEPKITVAPEVRELTTPITIMPEEKPKIDGHIIASPIVGTFYASPDVQKPPFVKLGDKVKKGDILCILEAMKIMNEVTSDVDGVIAEIFIENEEMVEYQQPLFKIV